MANNPGPLNNIPGDVLAQLSSLLAPFLGNTATASGGSTSTPDNPSPAPPTSTPISALGSQQAAGQRLVRSHAVASVLPSISAYQSTRLLGLPASASQPQPVVPSLSPPRTFLAPPASQLQSHLQPPHFLGFHDTRQANASRLASAAVTLPRRTTAALRAARSPFQNPPSSSSSGSRRGARGAASPLPTLSQNNGLDGCLTTSILDGNQKLRVLCKIYPPLEAQAADYVVFLQRRDSFNQSLLSHHLLHRLELSPDTSIRSILSILTEKLESSPYRYSFGDSNDNPDTPAHEALPLTLLRVSNRARRRPSTNQIHLVEHPVVNEEITLRHVANDNSRFVFPDISFEDGHFVLFFAIRSETLTARLPSNGVHATRMHNCIGLRIWSRFPNNSHVGRPPYDETSGGETDVGEMELTEHESEDEEMPDVGDLLDQASQRRIQAQSIATIPGPVVVSNARALDRSATLTSLASNLWSRPWTPPALSRHINQPFNLIELDDEVFETAVGALARIPDLSIRGSSVADLSVKLIEILGKAFDQNDFSTILSPNRHFLIEGQNGQRGDRGVLSVGRGIEREVLHFSFMGFTSESTIAKWLAPRACGYHSVAFTSRYAPSSRLRELGTLGALVGLMIVHGMAPNPISPGVLQYILHNHDLDSVHPKFVEEWLPELHHVVSRWLETPHTSTDIDEFSSHFSTYHDLQVAAIRDRDERCHKALAGEMLHRAVIGPEPSSHPEFEAFSRGLRLNCPASGFDLTKLLVLVDGGSEAVLNMVYGSNVKTFEDLSPHLRFKSPSPAVASQLASALERHGGATFRQHFDAFMRSTGIPCPALFEAAKAHFSPHIDLKAVDDENFRSRHFTWAATGSPALEVAGEGIQVILCGAGDTTYSSSSMSEAMMAHGKLCFKTCFKQVRIPVPYISHLASSNDPAVFQTAFDHWLLVEILSGIGGHSIL